MQIPPVLRSYLEFCSVRRTFRRTGKLRLDSDFVFPTTLLPLAVIVATTGKELTASNSAVQGYANWIVAAGTPTAGANYVPLVRLPKKFDACGEILRRLEDLSQSTQLFSGNQNAYHYLLSELVDNIYQHASADHAYVMAQFYPKKGLMEASFIDDGVTISKSLERGTGAAYAHQRAYQAILDATSGASSKPGGMRGFGLSSTVRIVNALGGETLVVSGRGALLAAHNRRPTPYALTAAQGLDGTLVSLRLPESGKRVNFYELVEG